MNEQSVGLKKRTNDFSVRVIKFVESMPRRLVIDVVSRQVLRSATSVAANYRSACRARSRAEFASKLHVVLEEADESQYWLDLLAECGIRRNGELEWLRKEATELTAIFTASWVTVRRNMNREQTSTVNASEKIRRA